MMCLHAWGSQASFWIADSIQNGYHTPIRFEFSVASGSSGRAGVNPGGNDHHEGPSAPKLCPACLHPTDHFELLVEPF